MGMSPIARLLSVVLVLALASALRAGPVEIYEVRFDYLSRSGSEEWMEIAIGVQVEKDRSDELRTDDRFVDDLQVGLSLGFENRREGQTVFDFYYGAVTLVSLEAGRHTVRFYLPPEIVTRDRYRGEPHSFAIELNRGERQDDLFLSRALRKESALASFWSRVEEARESNDGILRPQRDSPFFTSYPDSTPTARIHTDRR